MKTTKSKTKTKAKAKAKTCETNCNIEGFIGIIRDVETLGLEMLKDALKSKRKFQSFIKTHPTQFDFIKYCVDAVEYFTDENFAKKRARKNAK